jgi:SagB-type dehydrogenase family enzyme
LRAPAKRTAAAGLSARLSRHIALEARADGNLVAAFDGYSVGLGKFSADAVDRARELRTGLPLGSLASGGGSAEAEIERLVRRLAERGLLEYRLGHAHDGKDLVVIEPQVPDYWPRTPKLGATETIVLSRFAYLRRRGSEMVLESPRSGALFRICDPKLAAIIATLSTPQPIRKLKRQDGFAGIEILGLLVDGQILFKVEAAGDDGLRATEGDDRLVLWDFHDLLFHSRSTEGRHANPSGGLYPYAGAMAPPPALRPRWPGKKIDLRKLAPEVLQPVSPFAKLLQERHSIRSFDDQKPITLAELARLLDCAARVRSTWKSRIDLGDGGGPMVDYAAKPYPSAGAGYELELYLAVAHCEGIPRGFYHYDAGGHALMPIAVRADQLDAQLNAAAFAMDAPAAPQILVTIAARFDRLSWKYSSIAYALILKDTGVLIQTLYLTATDMGLGGCAIGSTNIDLFAKMTGIEFHVEGPVGLFALGRGGEPETTG